MLQKFISGHHYNIDHDSSINMPHVNLQKKGKELISAYYAEKYHTNIQFHDSFDDFSANLTTFLNVAHKHSKEYRAGFFIGTAKTHAVPVVYIKQNNEDYFFCGDSLGINIHQVSGFLISSGRNKTMAEGILKITGIKSHIIENQRQADLCSCEIDTFVFLRNCIGINPVNATYIIPNLAAFLTKNCEEKPSYYSLNKLPPELLTTSQISNFVRFYQDKNSTDIIAARSFQKKPEKLSEFQNRYKENKLSHYLREKSIKFSNLIEIQFYIEQFKKIIKWNDELRNTFISQAKYTLYQQMKITINTKRQGLYEIANIFLEQVSKGEVITSNNPPSSKTINPFTESIANMLFDIIADNSYWKHKSHYTFDIIPAGIKLMQDMLKQMKDHTTIEGKISALRNIAQCQLNASTQKSFLYLFTSIDADTRDPITIDFYRWFMEDWNTTPLFHKIYYDWNSYNAGKNRPLPSMSDYQRTRVRF